MAPPEGAEEEPLAPPNWKRPPLAGAAGAGVEEPPKLKTPGELVAGAALPALFPDAKGLLMPPPVEPPAEKLNPNPPDAGAAGCAETPFDGAGAEDPNSPLDGAEDDAEPKANLGVSLPPLPPVKSFLAGEESSCFIGLPPNNPPAVLVTAGDLGIPKIGLRAAS